MSKFSSKSLGGMVATVALIGAFNMVDSTASYAQTPIYGGGGTLAAFVLRDLANCWGSVSTLAPMLGTTSCTGGVNSVYPGVGEVLYVPTGTGAGQTAYLNDAPFGAASQSTPPYTSGDFPAYPFPTIDFAAGDVPFTVAQVTAFASAHGAALGPAMNLPELITSVTLPFNTSGLTIVNSPPTDNNGTSGTSGLMLSRNNMCGIFSGNITDWDDPQLAADNASTPLSSTSLPIKIIFRHDGSGTTGLISAALISQCAGVVVGGTSYAMPTAWGSSGTSYFINARNASVLPAIYVDETTITGGEAGSGGIVDAVSPTSGAIGYVSPDYAAPFGVSGHPVLVTANLQNQHSVSAGGAPVFTPPTIFSATAIMSTVSPPPANSPANASSGPSWATNGVSPNPTSADAYAIGGFSWTYPYSCYHDATTVAALLTGTQGLYKFIWGMGTDATTVTQVLGAHGFAPLPSAWLTAANHAAFRDSGTKIRRGGGANAAFCSTGA